MSKARTLADLVSAGGAMRVAELAANGTNTAGLKAPDALAADVTWKLPTADGSNGQALITDGAGNLSWGAGGGGGGSGTVLESAKTISTNISLTAAKNGISVGPVTIATGVSVTIPTGQRWLILA
ncbi:MAG: hypothetical protein EB124_12750 [Betaproteobacteria bacterium]|nr:hypothetical protein [Betaproteobacteria bacterium]